MIRVKNGRISGQEIRHEEARLSRITFKGYWADTDGQKIDKVSFGTTVRFYIEKFWMYNAKLKIYIKSGSCILQEHIEEKIEENTIDKLIPSYFTGSENFLEIKLKKQSEYKSLQGTEECELCCDVADGFNWFCNQKEVAKIKIETLSIIFPLLEKPLNDKGMAIYKNRYWTDLTKYNSAAFGSGRNGGRKHAGRDLYGIANETEIVSICDGVVLGNFSFYNSTNEISILHMTKDGRKFIARYGEVSPSSVVIKEGDKVRLGQVIAKVGKLNPQIVIEGKVTNMLHFELYSGKNGYDLKQSLTNSSGSSLYKRRLDLLDPLSILQEGYNNLFK